MFRASEQLATIISNQNRASFEEVYKSYQDDPDLNSYLDRLIEALQELLNHGDDELSARAVAELREILGAFENRSEASLNELAIWLNFLFTALSIQNPEDMAPKTAALIAATVAASNSAKKRLAELFDKAASFVCKRFDLKNIERHLTGSDPSFTANEIWGETILSLDQNEEENPKSDSSE